MGRRKYFTDKDTEKYGAVEVGRSKYFTHKDTKKYGAVKGFRLQPTEEGLLIDCFYMLGVEGNNFSQKMQNFILATHKAIKRLERLVVLEEENKQLKEKVEKLENERLKERVKEVEEKEISEKRQGEI